MKFSTAKEHRDFFQKHGWIEFEGFIPADQLTLVNHAIDLVLAERSKVIPERLKTLSSEKMFLEGRDLWRLSPFLQKYVAHSRFTEIASELIEVKSLRLGYDQFFPSRQEKPFANETSQVYSHFLEQITPLQTVSCLKGIACGFMISLGGKEVEKGEKIEDPLENPVEGIDVFPREAGHVIFFQPNLVINWNQLYSHLGQKYYMVVYTQIHANYQLEPQDPHTHTLKRVGYVFNDKLDDRLNPIIYR